MPVHIATTWAMSSCGDLGHLGSLRLVPRGADLLDVLLGLGLGVAQVGRDLVVLVVDRRFLLLGDALELLLRFLELGRRARRAQADAAGGLVDEVDRLVGQVAVRDVADRQVGRGLDRVVGDLDLVMVLVAASGCRTGSRPSARAWAPRP